jgi:uncharacterized protein
MPREVLRKAIKKYLAAPVGSHAVAFQGGEPLLMGEAFFREVAELEQGGPAVFHSVQTNGTLLTPGLAEFFAEGRWLLGVSCDGPAAVHDLYRKDAAGNGSHAAVLRGLALLDGARAEYNILTLVSKANVHEPEATYRYVRDELHCNFHQYIECTDPATYAVTAEEWGEFLCRLFDCWCENDTRRVSVRLFDALIAKLALGRCVSCSGAADCRQYLVVDWNGDVYPCDFFVGPEFKLGNVMTDNWQAMLGSAAYKQFGLRKQRRARACSECLYLSLCQGDCVKNRIGFASGADAAAPSCLCAGWRMFFEHAMPRLRALADVARGLVTEGAK